MHMPVANLNRIHLGAHAHAGKEAGAVFEREFIAMPGTAHDGAVQAMAQFSRVRRHERTPMGSLAERRTAMGAEVGNGIDLSVRGTQDAEAASADVQNSKLVLGEVAQGAEIGEDGFRFGDGIVSRDFCPTLHDRVGRTNAVRSSRAYRFRSSPEDSRPLWPALRPRRRTSPASRTKRRRRRLWWPRPTSSLRPP